MAITSYGKCSMTVLGLDMNCPLCGVLVKSGESHDCEKSKPKVVSRKKVKKASK